MRDELGKFKKGNQGFWKNKKRPTFSKKWKKNISKMAKKGANHYRWKGGKKKHKDGYIFITQPNHPFANSQGYVFEHRFVAEKTIGRYLKSSEIVHHINEIRNDNRPKNLIIFKNGMYHFWFHKKGSCNPIGIIFDSRKL